MIRTVFVPDNENVVFSVPKEYVGKRIEVTILPADDILVDYITPEKKKISFTSVSLDTRGWKFDREEANAR
ncbi:MAG: hypothetical protein LBS46_00295 [Dysgonamonadaceae bacterium]|jgi:hypothetical protein|nr:hypothetical protein [Dysgonamonadaceae bacterium]